MAPEKWSDKHLLLEGDLLFARSGATVGKTYLHDVRFDPAVFAGYCIRFRFNDEVLPEFVYGFTKTDAYSSWVGAIQRPTGQPNINKEEFKSLEIPLPTLDIQRRLVAELDATRAERDRALAEAEQLIVTFDDYLLNKLGLTLPDENTQKAFAVRLDAVRGNRIDPPSYQPILARGATPKVPIKVLSDLAIVNGNSIEKPDDIETLVPYVGLPECDQTEVREVAMRPYREVKGRSVIRPGDILFARIEPSIFNKKYILVDDLKGHEYAYTSTEFYVVSHRPGVSVTEYIYSMLFCSFVYAQSQGKTTGSSGRRRLDPDHFRSLKIPAPELNIQQSIATEAIRRREESRCLRTKAETVWREARERFEQQLLQGGKA